LVILVRARLFTASLLLAALLIGAHGTYAQSQSERPQYCGGGSEKPVTSDYVATAEDTRFVKEVVSLMTPGRPSTLPWPPAVQVTSDTSSQACALELGSSGANGTKVAYVIVYTGLLRDVVQGRPDRLAFILGHEFGHIALGHTARGARETTEFLRVTFTRDQEFAADQYGMTWVLKTGYSFDESLKALISLRQTVGDYSSFEALQSDHPSLSDRIAELDKNQAVLWRAMSNFSSGVYFLETEQYALAERCFRSVTDQFPESFEAWANLGYAQLMQYADALDQRDLRRFGIGQVLVGGFYRRPASLEAQVRGINEQLWWDAVGDLKESLRRRPDLAASYANLGIAYLIAPSGSNPRNAQKYLEQAYQLVGKDPSLDPMSRVTLVINLAVTLAAGGDYAKFDQLMDEAQSALDAIQKKEPGISTLPARQAIVYNSALRLAGSSRDQDQRGALQEIEGYLTSSSPDSAWWDLAYEHYSQLCTRLNIPPKASDSFKSSSPRQYRPVISLNLSKGALTLGESVREVKSLLGAGEISPAIPNTNLMLIRYPSEGLELIANDRVLAIKLTTSQHPVPVRQEGLETVPSMLNVGMQMSDVVKVLGSYDVTWILDPEEPLWFYTQPGLAVKAAQGLVTEIVLVQVPRKALL
jgi:tetratricopeptide (TPR) repeat protein